MIGKICEICKRLFFVKPYRDKTARFCSRSCLAKAKLPSIEEPRLAAVRGKKAHNNAQIEHICSWCGNVFLDSPSRDRTYCSIKCRADADRVPNNDKYVRATIDGKRVLVHRWVMEQIIGRPLLPEEEVNHKNRIKSDNWPDNLEIVDKKTHGFISSLVRGKPIVDDD